LGKTVGCLILVSASLVLGHTAPERRRPNAIVIVIDDLGYGELGCYGGTAATPNLDRLAAGGVRFTQAYVTAPFCAASRAAMLTGTHQCRFGFERNPIGAQNSDPRIGLPSGIRTMSEHLRESGYATGLIGKWHLGGTAVYHPERRGFDQFVGFLHEGHSYVPRPWEGHTTWLRRKSLPDGSKGRWSSSDGRVHWTTHMGHFEPDYDADNPILRSSQSVDCRRNLTDFFADEAVEFIERHRSQPFLLWLAFNAVHSPMQAQDRFLERFASVQDVHRRIFLAMLAQLDDAVGRVDSKLSELGLREDTLVFVLSDNGGPTRELTSSNHPWRGEKGQLWEGGIRVPMLLRWPAGLAEPTVEPRVVSSLDMLPTVLAATHAKSPPPMDGHDLIAAMREPTKQPIHKALYWRAGHQAAYRRGDWKLVRFAGTNAPWQLYDLKNDPGEQRDLAQENSDQLKSMIDGWTSTPRWSLPFGSCRSRGSCN
jgi:arylsulfatase B